MQLVNRIQIKFKQKLNQNVLCSQNDFGERELLLFFFGKEQLYRELSNVRLSDVFRV